MPITSNIVKFYYFNFISYYREKTILVKKNSVDFIRVK